MGNGMKLYTEKNDSDISQVILGQKSKTEMNRMNQRVPVIPIIALQMLTLNTDELQIRQNRGFFTIITEEQINPVYSIGIKK